MTIHLAIFISGRITRYEDCLKPQLEKCPYYVDLFLSLNSVDCEYNKTMKKELGKWLKGVYIEPFHLPSSFIHTHPHNNGYQEVEGRVVPFYQMSMFFNDGNAFRMIENYCKENDKRYDVIMKLRADMFDYSWPDLSKVTNDRLLYSITPQCMFKSHGLFQEEIVSDASVWGNMEVMKIYCDTYNFVLKMLEETKGDYYINFEDCVTDNVYSHNLPFVYENIHYKLDGNRRIFDIITRNTPDIPSSCSKKDINTVDKLSIKPYDPFS